MINIQEHHSFKKQFLRLSAKQKVLFIQRLEILKGNPKHPLLRIHPLKGNLRRYFSFSLGGDLRVQFQWVSENTICLYKIGTHNQVY